MAHLNLNIFFFSFVAGGGMIFKIVSFFKLDPAPDPYMGCTFPPEFKVYSSSSPICVSPKIIFGGWGCSTMIEHRLAHLPITQFWYTDTA